MKQSIKLSFLSLLFLFTVLFPAFSQNIFEGFIRYKIFLVDSAMNAPEFMEYYLKENNLMVRIFLKNEDELARILFLGKENTLYMIDDVQKTAMKIRVTNDEQPNPGSVPDEYREAYDKAVEKERMKNISDRFRIIETGIIENIAGYPCNKYNVIDTQNQGDSFVWLTEKISFDMPKTIVGEDNPLFRFIGDAGFPLRFTTTDKNERVILMEAIRIEEKKLTREIFLIPSDYQISDISSFLKGN